VNVASQYGGHSSQVGGGVMFSGQPFISGPVADMAVQYGHTLAGQGTEFVHKNVSTMINADCFALMALFEFCKFNGRHYILYTMSQKTCHYMFDCNLNENCSIVIIIIFGTGTFVIWSC